MDITLLASNSHPKSEIHREEELKARREQKPATKQTSKPKNKSPKTLKNKNPSVMASYRRSSGLGQQKFAKKFSIGKRKIEELEHKSNDQIRVGDIAMMAKALNIAPSEIFDSLMRGPLEGWFMKSNTSSPFYSIGLDEGVRLDSFISQTEICFVGQMTIKPHKTLSKRNCLKSSFLHFQVIKGDVFVSLPEHQQLFAKNEYFAFRENISYSFYNPSGYKETVMNVIAVPGLIKNN